jgi:hypothetical protein
VRLDHTGERRAGELTALIGLEDLGPAGAAGLAVSLVEHEEWDDQENAVMMERLRIDEERVGYENGDTPVSMRFPERLQDAERHQRQ